MRIMTILNPLLWSMCLLSPMLRGDMMAKEEAASQDPAVTFSACFEDSLDTEGAGKPVSFRKTTFAPGQSGKGLLIDELGYVTYRATDILSWEAGSVEMKIKTTWGGDELERNAYFFDATGLSENKNRIALYAWCDKSNRGRPHVYLSFSIRDKNEKTRIITENITDSWQKDAWQHLVATWKTGVGLALYVNGKPVGKRLGEKDENWEFDAGPKTFTVGAPYYYSFNSSSLASAGGVIDEVKILSGPQPPPAPSR